jgi:hypothetical protein
MMARRRAARSDADRMRLHNEEFRYALAHNLTILQARNRLGQLRMRALEERVHPPLRPAIGLHEAERAIAGPPERHFWWEDRD